jgi:hypothetical protein
MCCHSGSRTITHPSYLKINNCPLLFVWQPRIMLAQLAGVRENENRARQDARAVAARRASRLRVSPAMDADNAKLGADIASSGWDAVTRLRTVARRREDGGDRPAGLA